jgi:PilZ domain
MESEMSQASLRPDFGYISDERRSHPRRPVSIAAEIAIGDSIHHECTIMNISEGGALVAIPAGCVLPDQFMLIPPSRLCRVAWRNGNYVGVAFQTEEPFTDI